MKKKVYTMFWVSFLVVLIGCYKRNPTTIEQYSCEQYSIIEYNNIENDENFSKDIKYPQLICKDDYYKDVNILIVDAINEFEILNKDYFNTDSNISVRVSYEVTCQTEAIVSLKFNAIYYVQGTMHPIHMGYGLTINLNKFKVVMLSQNVESVESIVENIKNGDYGVEYGTFEYMTQNEIIEYVQRGIKEEKFAMYKYNYYLDENYYYVIVDEVIGSHYGVLKFDRTMGVVNNGFNNEW